MLPSPQELPQEHDGEPEGDEADGVAGDSAAVQDGQQQGYQLAVVLRGRTLLLGLLMRKGGGWGGWVRRGVGGRGVEGRLDAWRGEGKERGRREKIGSS